MEEKKDEFDFFRLLEIVSSFADSEPGKENILFCKSSQQDISMEYLYKIYEEVNAAKDLIRKGEEPTFSGLKDIKQILTASIMDTKEILIFKQQLYIAERVKSLKEEPFQKLCLNIILMPEIKKIISSSIDEEGNILDSATNNLAKIRKELKTQRNRIISKLKKLSNELQIKDNIITQREERYTIPVPVNKRGEIDGLVIDTSRKGTTLFIEPYTVVSENNRIKSLRREEQEEIHRILQNITSEIKLRAEDFVKNQKILSEFDGIFARARYGNHIDGVIPQITSEPLLELKKAKHPIIQESRDVVPFDITLDEKSRTLVVSGPNTGGKTVLLKSIGLIVNMAYAGIPIPAEEAKIPLFNGIYADIEDKQSIDEGLSTFSSHINRLKYILSNSRKNSLVLLDEPGGGTDPDEGAALAISIIECLAEKGVFLIATTHYEKLKYFVSSQKNMLNGAMKFDARTHKPTYQLVIGIPGSSNAIEVASQLGIDKEIIDRAKKYLSSEKIKIDTLIRDLMKEKQIVEENKEKYQKLFQKYKSLEEEYEEKLRSAQTEAKNIINTAKEKAVDIVKNSRSMIESTIKEIKESQAKKETIKAEKEKIENFIKKNTPVSNTSEVKLKEKSKRVSFYFEKDVPLEINVIGLNREDAWEKVDKFIDDAILVNYETISIIHGLGSGILKRFIRKQLEKDKRVIEFYPASPEQGGQAITIVKI